jgi:hypothetical protein
MDENESLSHSRWECKYHVVFIPKCRRRKWYKELRQHLGEVFKRLASQKESRILEGHLMPDHAHVDCDTAEVCGVASDRIHQREEIHSFRTSLCGEEAQFCRSALLHPRA